MLKRTARGTELITNRRLRPIFCASLLAGIGLFSELARATVTVTIGAAVETVASGVNGLDSERGVFTLNNFMADTTMQIDGFDVGALQVSAPGFTVSAGGSRTYLDWDGTPQLFQIYGHLANPVFTLGGQEYQAVNADWITPQMLAGQDGATFGIDIQADAIDPIDPPDPVPELGSISFLATILAALAWRVRQRPQTE
ncbi:MAG TPA: hypothetical protein VKX45_21720 [Bryobacteraceae bacterium]|jgi:hypothetical protein|nr:hypothetical protein [Bryobacteraceae bacterium]